MLPVLAALALCLVGFVITFTIVYLLVLLFAAALYKPSPTAAIAKYGRFTVVIPAHNEELVLAATLKSLAAQDYPANSYEIVVVADNCTDTTASIARKHGAIVLERSNLNERGKGYALDWVFQQLISQATPADAFVIVDADTLVAPNFLSAAANHLSVRDVWSAHYALQGRYGVENFGDGWRTALMSAAFDLFNHIKPCGREKLKLSVGLKGNGMVFTLPLMKQARWSGSSVTEDIDFGVALAREHRLRVAYEPLAIVKAQMPANAQQATSQRRRWELGRYELVKQKALPLLREGLERKNGLILDTALDLMLLPMGELAAVSIVWSTAMLLSFYFFWHSYLAVGLVLIGCFWIGLLVYILYGLRVAGAQKAAYTALIFAPVYVVWKLLLYVPSITAKLKRGKPQPEEWVRTERAAIKTSAEDRPMPEGNSAERETIQ
jgi:cellulose synthase/poly-beta-1,6-N-acetylglucosamine synthase-like glycosyltransferase